MRRDQQMHDDVIVEIVYVLLTSVVFLIGFLVIVWVTGAALGLDTMAWRYVGDAVLGFAALGVLGRAMFLLSRSPTQSALD